MAFHSHSVQIEVPPAEVFAYVNEPKTLPEWLCGMMEIRNVRGSGEGLQYDFTYNMAGIQVRGQNVVVEYREGECATHQGVGMIEHLWTNRVEPAEGGTKLTIELEYTIPVPVLGRLAERLTIRRNARDMDHALINAKEILEGEVSSPSSTG